MNKLIVPYGKTTSLILSDSSKIWVNSGTTLIYPPVFDLNKREIYVEGEIYIEVAKKDTLPFVVKTAQMNINVHGTKFNVSAYKEDETQFVVLVEGSVAVKNKKLEKEEELSPDDKYEYSNLSNKDQIEKVNSHDYICWRQGFLHFEDEHLNVVLKKLERFYNIPLHYDADAVKKIIVSGKLDLEENIENVLNIISITTSITFYKSENYIKIEVS